MVFRGSSIEGGSGMKDWPCLGVLPEETAEAEDMVRDGNGEGFSGKVFAGFLGEVVFRRFLHGRETAFKVMEKGAKWDFEVNGQRIDVKTRTAVEAFSEEYWCGVERQKLESRLVDWYVFQCWLKRDNEILVLGAITGKRLREIGTVVEKGERVHSDCVCIHPMVNVQAKDLKQFKGARNELAVRGVGGGGCYRGQYHF